MTILDRLRVTGYPVVVRIAESARRHGVQDDDMLHALRNANAYTPVDDDFMMLCGPDRTGTLIEVGVLSIHTDSPCVIHAYKPCREQYLP